MAVALKTVLADPDTQKTLVAGLSTVLQSAPIVAAATVGAIFVSWQLEHLALETMDVPVYDNVTKVIQYTVPVEREVFTKEIGEKAKKQIVIKFETRSKTVTERVQVGTKKGRGLVRLSTNDTSFLTDPNKTPLMPPIQSTAIRLADAGSDVAEAAFALAQQQLDAVKSGGLIKGIQEFIFGGG